MSAPITSDPSTAPTPPRPGVDRSRVVRYTGRLPGAGIDDTLSGPATVLQVLSGAAAVIADPLSFPWRSAEPTDWRRPAAIDLRQCSEKDLTALEFELRVVTPNDRLVVGDAVARGRLADVLALPESTFITDLDGIDDALVALGPAKLDDALRREILAPLIRAELAAMAGIGDEARRPLTVVDVGATDRWRASMVPAPHVHEVVAGADSLADGSADIAFVAADHLDTDNVGGILDGLRSGGLLVVLLSNDDVSRSGAVTVAQVVATIETVTGPNRLVEHVWGMHEHPGLPTLGGLIGIRPLQRPTGSNGTRRPNSSSRR